MPIVLAGLLLLGSSARAEAPDYLAQQRFTAGRVLYDAGDFEGALNAFRSSAKLRLSPNTALYIARSLRHLGRVAEAVAAYDQVISAVRQLADAGPYQRAMAAAREELAVLELRVARLSVRCRTAPAGLRVRLGARVLTGAPPWHRVPVETGPVDLIAEAPGHQTVRRTLSFVATQHLDLELVLQPTRLELEASSSSATSLLLEQPPSPRPRHNRGLLIAGWSAAGAGTASLIASLVFWRMAQNRYDDLNERCGGAPCPRAESPVIDEGRRYQTATNVTLGIGLGVVGAGAALIATSYLVGERPAAGLSVDGAKLSFSFP